MSIKITPRTSIDGRKIHYTFEWGKKAGQRKASGIFTFTHPGSLSEILHNEEALRILEVKKPR